MPVLRRHPGSRPERGERPDRPFTGYKLARPVLSADGRRAGFAGLSLGASLVYGTVAEASCAWGSRHAPPRRRCGCGFYCLHEISEARALGCATANRSAVLLEVAASGRYIRYERGLRYSRQRVKVIRDSSCDCGRPGTSLAEAGTGLVGWRHLTPVCERCAAGRPAVPMAEFAALLDGPVRVEPGAGGALAAARAPAADAAGGPADSPVAVLAAEITLLHARLDDLQARLDG